MEEPRSSTWAAGFWSCPTASLRKATPAAAPTVLSNWRRSIMFGSSCGPVCGTHGNSGWPRPRPRNPGSVLLEDPQGEACRLRLGMRGIGLDHVLQDVDGRAHLAASDVFLRHFDPSADETDLEFLVGHGRRGRFASLDPGRTGGGNLPLDAFHVG